MISIFCNKCGNKLEKEYDSCVSCGTKSIIKINDNEACLTTQNSNRRNLETKVWYRALKVFYITIIVISLFIIVGMGLAIYDGLECFKYTSIAFLILWLVAYLIKIGFFYIVIGEKPQIKFLK